MKPRTNRIKISAYLTPDIWASLTKYSDKLGLNKSGFVAMLIGQYAITQDGLEAINDLRVGRFTQTHKPVYCTMPILDKCDIGCGYVTSKSGVLVDCQGNPIKEEVTYNP